MKRSRPEPVQVIKQRRDAALEALVGGVPYIRFLGIRFDRRGDELTSILPYDDMLIGNPELPALHGGATAAFLEVTAVIGLSWAMLWRDLERGVLDPAQVREGHLPRLPKTIGLTVDYLRSGLPRDAYARAEVTRSGRRYASVRVEAWQDNVARPIAQATGHFRMPGNGEASE
ncbi:PaaI family thioesterase [Pseudooceanicola sediminis]|uniref:PaaI family thioesterase n=1 Tax=Pseudooceanicola sediminis TaxID=2211117 RepID=A0A399J477_9RHOB|nr:PaaI family thioesterase [Pseudooceanicola sediminis]KAA2313960.1 PaaI family thioesterase [Puniceibacterium sp. HSS470]RII38772.1 PaaI family thioesterase [Pseudooceanicola sediminis]|tara:strand:- start:90756 stop:91274 length:519 start_codon:yes stop_codon:yes gene_type:complete